MPYNYLGDLKKREIVQKLQEAGCGVRNVNELNKNHGRNGVAQSLW